MVMGFEEQGKWRSIQSFPWQFLGRWRGSKIGKLNEYFVKTIFLQKTTFIIGKDLHVVIHLLIKKTSKKQNGEMLWMR